MKNNQSTQFVGLDLGKMQDPTAIAILERESGDPICRLRGISRLPLGTAYADVAQRVVQVLDSLPSPERRYLVVDATGVGLAVIEMLEAELGRQAVLVPVMFTGGSATRQEDGIYHVPKKDLVSGLTAMLSARKLKISGQMRQQRELMRELMTLRAKIGGTDYTSYAAWRVGDHDDMVFALALACWLASRTSHLPAIDLSRLQRY